jgi:hypothetical protein
MKKEIFVHIGYNKTGTSSIQAMMYQNADLLLKHGIYYPTLNCNHSKFLFSMFVSNPEKKRMNTIAGYKTKQQVAELNASYQRTIEEELNNPKIQKVIFSGEHLIALNAEEVKNFHKWLSKFSKKITIVCCTRNPVGWYNSRIQQQLKERTKDISSVCKNLCTKAKINYFSLMPFLETFGKENIVAYDFDKHKKNIYGKFMHCCNIDAQLQNTLIANAPDIQNESLSHECCLILSSMNQLKPWDKNSNLPFVEPSYLYKIKGQKFTLAKAAIEKILAHNRDGLEWIASNFPECAAYNDWKNQLEQYQEATALFQENTLEELSLLISNLIDENEQLKTAPFKAIYAYPYTWLKGKALRCPMAVKIAKKIKRRLTKS